MSDALHPLVDEIAQLLLLRNRKIVFAESCTAGLISATLSRRPGISEHHCGSAVVYRLETKTRWLGVPEAMLVDPGPVSEDVARAMVEGVLSVTPEADLAAAITGHLGPHAPEEQDGLAYIGIAFRGKPATISELRLPRFADAHEGRCHWGDSVREKRQWRAVQEVFSRVAIALRAGDSIHS